MLFFEVKVTVVCVSWVIIISQKIRYAYSWLHTGVSSVLHASFFFQMHDGKNSLPVTGRGVTRSHLVSEVNQ